MRQRQIQNLIVLAVILILLVLMIVQRLQKNSVAEESAVVNQENQLQEQMAEGSYISAKDQFLDILFSYNYAGRYETFLEETKELKSEEQMQEAVDHYYAVYKDLVNEEVLHQLIEDREPLKYDRKAFDEGSSFRLVDMSFNGDNGTFETRVLWTRADGSQEMDRVKGRIEENNGLVNKFFIMGMGEAPEIYYVRKRATDLEAFDYHTVLQLNTEDRTFALSYDLLSSYMPYGTYEETENKITCRTDDGEYTFIFSKEGRNLLFQAEGSGNLNCNTGKGTSVPAMENGDVFVVSVTGDNLVQKKYHLELSGWEDELGNPKEYYDAGEEVELHYGPVAADTDYLFYLDNEEVLGEGNGDGYVIRFQMPDHDAVFSVESRNSMNKGK